MGMGDWIMATAQVARLHAAAQRPVTVVDRWGPGPVVGNLRRESEDRARQRARQRTPQVARHLDAILAAGSEATIVT